MYCPEWSSTKRCHDNLRTCIDVSVSVNVVKHRSTFVMCRLVDVKRYLTIVLRSILQPPIKPEFWKGTVSGHRERNWLFVGSESGKRALLWILATWRLIWWWFVDCKIRCHSFRAIWDSNFVDWCHYKNFQDWSSSTITIHFRKKYLQMKIGCSIEIWKCVRNF